MRYWKHTRDEIKMILFLEQEAKMPYTREWFLNDSKRLFLMYEKEFAKYRKRLSTELTMEYKKQIKEERLSKQKDVSVNQFDEDDDLPF
ncbi:hypothetical protein ACFC9N_10705 [Enterococcus casseliflavus]|uniref:hypothetical protein n=1 Tax=Enterococcus TaxID=1350 RepID=UPI000A384179|nr:hypothetical protein [Enterococcus sp. 4E1_DIV0656]OTO09137.1 hypothetical protein A5882_003467 [Enterococcus sp. 4E1_DIV0656]